MKGSDSLAAGFVLIAVSLAFAAAGIFVGDVLGSRVGGGFVGGVVGIVAGFRVVYRMYFLPQRKAMESRDYSHLESKWNDDE